MSHSPATTRSVWIASFCGIFGLILGYTTVLVEEKGSQAFAAPASCGAQKCTGAHCGMKEKCAHGNCDETCAGCEGKTLM